MRVASRAAASASLEASLGAIGCGAYASVFAAEEIDVDALKLLSEADLRDLDVPTVKRNARAYAGEGASPRGSNTVRPPRVAVNRIVYGLT
jgi:hypothetical protein